MCGSNTLFFLILCGMLFILLGFLAWLASKDGSRGHSHAAQTEDAPAYYEVGKQGEAVPVYAVRAKRTTSNG